MCCEERNTQSRGRPAACLAIRLRTRRCRRPNRSLDLLLMERPLLLLAFLATDMLGLVLDALALVRLGLAEGADHRRDLADALAVGAADRDRGRLLADDLDIAGDGENDVVAVAQLQHEVLALHRGAVSDAVDLEIDGEALRDAGHHV